MSTPGHPSSRKSTYTFFPEVTSQAAAVSRGVFHYQRRTVRPGDGPSSHIICPLQNGPSPAGRSVAVSERTLSSCRLRTALTWTPCLAPDILGSSKARRVMLQQPPKTSASRKCNLSRQQSHHMMVCPGSCWESCTVKTHGENDPQPSTVVKALAVGLPCKGP